VLADYYLRPFKSAIKHGQARGVMCSYNAVKGKPTCLSPLIRNARAQVRKPPSWPRSWANYSLP
jgi:hypothetical protein